MGGQGATQTRRSGEKKESRRGVDNPDRRKFPELSSRKGVWDREWRARGWQGTTFWGKASRQARRRQPRPRNSARERSERGDEKREERRRKNKKKITHTHRDTDRPLQHRSSRHCTWNTQVIPQS